MRQHEKRTHKARAGKSTIDPYDLPNLPTKVLLRYLRSSYVPHYYLDDVDPELDSKTYGYSPVYKGPVIPYEDIKSELAKREHVMNKTEGYLFRRSQATLHHGPRNRVKESA